MKKHLPLYFLFLALLGCASSSEVADVRRDVTTVYREFRSYKDATDARLSKLEKDMSALNQSMRSVEELTRKQFVDLSMSAESNDEKIKNILGKLDELDSQLRAYWGETKGELKELKGTKNSSPGVPPKKAPVAPQGNYDEVYKRAFDAFQKGQYEDSIRAFSDFVQTYPDTPLAPNARYWMGEAYMNLKDPEKAIVSFQEVIDKYPNSEKAPRALLRQAEAFGALGDKKSSTTLLKRVVELYPKTDEARIAERLLRNLGQ
ncbi:MAG TPA: tol-pal system protein YbgF [Syntrophorhabdales bacterium]|nr:tol-pal system protein YbgF [Syntrophorhabdales bacterium]